MVNGSTTSSLANRWSNAGAPRSGMSEGGWSLVFSSPHSGRGLVWSAFRIFALWGRFGVRQAVNWTLIQSISQFLSWDHGKPERSFASLGKHKRPNIWTTMTLMGKWTAGIDFYHGIDPGTRRPAYQDCRRRVGTSAKENPHGNPRNWVDQRKGLADVNTQILRNNAAIATERDIQPWTLHLYHRTDPRTTFPAHWTIAGGSTRATQCTVKQTIHHGNPTG